MIGSPLAGDRMLLVDIINARASSWASSVSGTCTAIWSPSKSALYAAQTRVKLDSLTFDQNRFKCLDTQTVKSWRTVEQHWVFANDFSENVPNLWQFALDHFLRSLDGGSETTHFKLAENERLEQLESHFLRQTALMQTQGRTYGNYRTTRVVNTLTEQVLTETTLLTLDHVSQGFQRTLVGTCDCTTATTVVE